MSPPRPRPRRAPLRPRRAAARAPRDRPLRGRSPLATGAPAPAVVAPAPAVAALALVLAAALASASAALLPAPAAAQETFPVEGPDGEVVRIPIERHRGYAAFSASHLARLGFDLRVAAGELRTTLPGGPELGFRPGSPFVRWAGGVRQLAAAPYGFGGRTLLPLQLLTDLLPGAFPERFGYDRVRHRMSVRDASLWRPGAAADPVSVASAAGRGPPPSASRASRDAEAEEAAARRAPSGPPVVVIDPGHGGTDPGARGPGGTLEKDVALAIGRAVARELRSSGGFEVHMTRETDTLIPLWRRGERATHWKGDRPGVFVSIHANAMPSNSSTRGFETYFLAEARTEHARRVAAIENASVELEVGGGAVPTDDPELGFILRELRTLDHQHWSALLAEMVQQELDPIHPGGNRGVKQGPFAVITNALMPAVLVEVGFLTNRAEERLLATSAFQDDAARAVARAVRRFFERYPPGRGEAP